MFKKDFVWGVATAAYQIEGGAFQDGRGLSVWDTFCMEQGNVKFGHTGNVACDHYHKYKEDVALMKELGVKNYRFSVSWSRIMPNGIGEVNPKGIDFYNNLIDELLANGITPYMTLFHWDTPQALEDRGGWRNPVIVPLKVGFSRMANAWGTVTPKSLKWASIFLYDRYKKPIFITENGMANNDTVSLDGKVHDPQRIDFLHRYIKALSEAADMGADIGGYFQWSFLDNFEWAQGYNERFGMIWVDYETLERIPKDSAYWYKNVMETNGENL